MARNEKQSQAGTTVEPRVAPAHPQPERTTAMLATDAGLPSQGAALDALYQRAQAFDNEVTVAERNVTRFREAAEQHEAYAKACRADAEACRAAIQRLSN